MLLCVPYTDFPYLVPPLAVCEKYRLWARKKSKPDGGRHGVIIKLCIISNVKQRFFINENNCVMLN